MWVKYNPNPIKAHRVGDCSVRAISKALDVDWDTAFLLIVAKAFEYKDMPSSDVVWGDVLKDNGFKKSVLPNDCPSCFTAAMFCKANPVGIYVLGFGGHVATAKDGNLYDSWNSSDETVIYYWHKS